MALITSIDDIDLPLADLLQRRVDIRIREILTSSDHQLKKLVRQMPANSLDRIILGLMAQTEPDGQIELARQAADRLSNLRGLYAHRTIHEAAN